MLDLLELLGLARSLMANPSPTDAELRRAVSSLYYAIFHTVLRAAALRFMGPGHEQSPGYTILYRSFDHGYMRTVCEALQASTLSRRYRTALNRTAASQGIRDFATAFTEFQDLRHDADYDPAARFLQADVVVLIDEAAVAIVAFDNAPADERTDVLALLMVKPRT